MFRVQVQVEVDTSHRETELVVPAGGCLLPPVTRRLMANSADHFIINSRGILVRSAECGR